jgi:hypothetical protein
MWPDLVDVDKGVSIVVLAGRCRSGESLVRVPALYATGRVW